MGHLATQFAKAMGFRVVAIDGGAHKEEFVKSLGAEIYVDFSKVRRLLLVFALANRLHSTAGNTLVI